MTKLGGKGGRKGCGKGGGRGMQNILHIWPSFSGGSPPERPPNSVECSAYPFRSHFILILPLNIMIY